MFSRAVTADPRLLIPIHRPLLFLKKHFSPPPRLHTESPRDLWYTLRIMINAASSLRRSVWALAIVTAVSPLAALAATPQQIVDANLQRLSTTQPASISGELKLTVTDKPVAKNAASSNGSVSFHFNSRSVPGANVVPNTEGDISITSFESSGMGVSIPTLTNPGEIEWKSVDGTAYVRISEIANNISSFLSMAGINTEALVGTWLKLNPSDVPVCANQSLCATSAIVSSKVNADAAAVVKSPLKVTRTEKKWKAENGDSMIRVRAIVNPTVLTNLRNYEIKNIGAKDTQRSAKLKEINTRYTEVRKASAGVEFALNINETDGTIERAEMGVTNRQPVKSCTTNKWKITTCKTISNVTTSMLTGMNFAPGKSDAIAVPSASITMDDVMKLLKK